MIPFYFNKEVCLLIYDFEDSVFRLNQSDIHGLPKIPAQVIGYGLAIELFKLFDENSKVIDSWAGIMKVTYTYGGKLKDGKYVAGSLSSH